MAVKVAVIGAGSLTFTRTLVHDLWCHPGIRDADIALTDINRTYLGLTTKLLKREAQANGTTGKIVSTLDRREALADADYVFNLTRIGGLDAYQFDIDIPLMYGVDQCVGDTLCAGGIMYGQRGIGAMLDFCADIFDVASPDALLLNYGNPNAMLTWAANAYGGVPTLGLCHGVQGGHHMICKVIELLVNGRKQPGSRGYVEVGMGDVDIICAGINHQTWYTQVIYNGEDWTARLLEGFEKHPHFSKTEKVRIDMLRRFGYFSTESNGHLSEYVPWYRKRPREIRKWIDMGSWINGETGGYLRVSHEMRNGYETGFKKMMEAPAWKIEDAKPSLEHGARIINALETGECYRGHLNVVNEGCISNLPPDAIVEVPCYIDGNGINIPRVGDLPLGCAAVCNASISVQRLAVEAAVHGDVELLKQAMLMDPLVGAVCNPAEVWQMTDRMLVAQAKWLPQYADAIAGARARLKQEPSLARFSTTGAARKKAPSGGKTAKARRPATRKPRVEIDIAEPE